MSYEIKSYDPDFLEDQVRVTFEVTDKWKYQPQLSVEGLRSTYSRDNFDPSTRLYAFYENQMIGCISSAKTSEVDGIVYGSTRTPFVLDNHNEPKQLLMDTSISALKKLGVKIIQASSSVNLGYSKEFLEANGFEKKQESFILAKEELQGLDLNTSESEEIEEITSYNPSYRSKVEKILDQWFPVNSEATFNFYLKSRERKGSNKASWQLFIKNGELQGLGILMQSDRNPNEYRGPHCYVSEYVDNKIEIIKRLYRAHINHFKVSDQSKIQLFLPLSKKGECKLYEEIGFQMDVFSVYEKFL